MSKHNAFWMLLTLIILFTGCNKAEGANDSITEATQKEKTEYEIIKSPYSHLFNNARNVWDMCIFDDSIYIGAGDYDKIKHTMQNALQIASSITEYYYDEFPIEE